MFEYGSLILIPPNDDGTLFTEEQLRTRATELLEKYGKVIIFCIFNWPSGEHFRATSTNLIYLHR